MHPQIERADRVCCEAGVGHVVLAGGLPPGGAIERIKASGAKLICFAPALALAKKLIRSGADALVIEGMEAGGHIGPVSTCGTGAGDPAERIAGRAGVRRRRNRPRRSDRGLSGNGRVGRAARHPLRCATESIAHANFKKAFIRASARDAIAIGPDGPALPVIPVRALKNAGIEQFRRQAARSRAAARRRARSKWPRPSCRSSIIWAGALRRAVIDGDVESGSVMAGQSVGMVTREEPVADIIKELVDEAAAALESRG